jgi:hypothetical protein
MTDELKEVLEEALGFITDYGIDYKLANRIRKLLGLCPLEV